MTDPSPSASKDIPHVQVPERVSKGPSLPVASDALILGPLVLCDQTLFTCGTSPKGPWAPVDTPLLCLSNIWVFQIQAVKWLD